MHKALKKSVAAAGLKGQVRVNHAGYMSQCGHGPMVVVYPEDTWYAGVDVDGAERIVREHLMGGVACEDYRYVAPPGDNKETNGAKTALKGAEKALNHMSSAPPAPVKRSLSACRLLVVQIPAGHDRLQVRR